MTRIKLIPILVMASLLFAAPAHSQFLGQMETAPTLLTGSYSFSGYAGVYDQAFAIFGGFRLGLTDYMDFGLKLGFLNYDQDPWDDETGIVFGGDLKYRILETEIGDPLDFSMGMGLEVSSVENFGRVALGGNMILSQDFHFENGRIISPYGRLNLRMERKSWEIPGIDREHHDTDFEMGLNVGVSLELTANTFLVSELQLDELDGIIIGANFYID